MADSKTHLVIIDPQNDFCDLPENYCPLLPRSSTENYSPALPVAGAHADMQRLANFIDRCGKILTDITVTLDSHQRIDISHPTFWQGSDGVTVAPFTQIQAIDVRRGRYLPRLQWALPKVLSYLDTLEKNGRYIHMVWPIHCETGTWGQNVHADVQRACNRWEEISLKNVEKVIKGTNPWTEHYSAIQAEVQEPDDIATQRNMQFLDRLREADRILIAGEAGSHCVRATVEHIVENLPAGNTNKLFLLADCMSPVSGFEAKYAEFISLMRKNGVRTEHSDELASKLLANAT